MNRRSWTRWLVMGLVIVALYLARSTGWLDSGGLTEQPSASGVDAAGRSDEAIARAFRERRSGTVFEGAGTVERLLSDDLEGSRHQRFILRLASGMTLMVSHNIDLARRIDPLEVGDRVAFRGQYEWNERGGVIHWTHHDPNGRRPGGWLLHEGIRYQ